MIGGDAHVIKDQRGGIGGADAHLVLVLVHGEARAVALHDEGGQAFHAGVPVGGGEHHKDVGIGGVGDKALGAVDDVLVALPDRGGAAGGGVGPGARLGQGKGAQAAAHDHVGVHLLLLRGAVHQHGLQAQGRAHQGGGKAQVVLGEFLHDGRHGHIVDAASAILLGDLQTVVTDLHRLLVALQWEDAVPVPLGGVGLDLLLTKIMRHGDQTLLVLVQNVSHRCVPPQKMIVMLG